MLKVKSFDIKDDEGINALLSEYILAKDAHILITNGMLAIPYEDGEAPNDAQRAIQLKEQKNINLVQVDLIIHSQLVLERQAKGITEELSKIEERLTIPKTKKGYDENKDVKAEKARLENVLNQTKNQIIQNQAELTRIKTNIDIYDERLNESQE